MSDKTPLEAEDSPEIIAKKAHLRNLLGNANAYANKINELTGRGVNPESGRLDHFAIKLIELGVITQEDFLDFEIEHTQKINEQMNDMLMQIEAEARSKKLVKPSMPKGGLIGPNGQRLI